MPAHRKKQKTRNKNESKIIKYSAGSILILFVVFFGIIKLSHAGFIPTAQAKVRTLRTIVKYSFIPVCGTVSEKVSRCHARVVTNQNNTPQAATTPPQAAYTPAMLHTAYELPCTQGGAVQSQCSQPASFGSPIAIVDAYNDTTVQNDLNTFSASFDLPACTTVNGCLKIVNETGGTSLPTQTNSSWALETSLDIQTAHAICQTCKLLLVETNSAGISDLATGNKTAANLGAVSISNSWGAGEFTGETSYDSSFTHTGVATFAAAGDSGYGSSYPGAVPGVISVGGTTLSLYTDNTYAGETVWADTGSGCSQYENAQSFQEQVANWPQTGCQTHKAIADIAEDADPNTGVAVYDSTAYDNQKGWWQVGGTSLASPLAAAIFALSYTPQDATIAQIASLLYQNDTQTNFHDITQGSNGSCGTIMCNAVSGYDGPTGLGSLIGTGAFETTTNPIATNAPVPTQLPTPTPTPPTNQPLTFANITASIGTTQATINWTTVIQGTTTQIPATTQIKYGTSSTKLTSQTPFIPTLTSTHTQTITNLKATTTYYLQLLSNNQEGTAYSSGIYYFKTTR